MIHKGKSVFLRILPPQLTREENQHKFEGMKRPIILGLGNPGSAYAGTRHNMGRDIVFTIGSNYGAEFEKKKIHRAEIAKVEIGGDEATLMVTDVLMNESGVTLRKIISSPQDRERLLVIHDDIDLPLGTWKLAFDRGEGGHNGLKSVSETLHSRAYLRIRVGVQPIVAGEPLKPRGEEEVVKFVLGKFTPDERIVVEKIQQEIVAAIPEIISSSRSAAMNTWNK
jgi:PTH1 family peptidyl-tRNA hydrolase